ncbi:MAG: response regulator [Hyphomicrobiales bacterium]|nr:MAG: response regulator [Hyphomicrobiales bacterium]
MQRLVLIGEDEALIALGMEAHLNDLGFSVHAATTINEAMEALNGRHFGAAILDFDVGGVGTAPVAEALRSRGIPFVICSGSSSDKSADVFANAETISKPYLAEHLAAAVRRAMREVE